MKRKQLKLMHASYVTSIVLLSHNNLSAEDMTTMSKIYTLDGIEAVYEQKENSIYAKEPVNAVSTNTLTKKALDNIGGPAQSNYYKALDILPGVNVQTADMSGIGAQNIKLEGKALFI